MTTEQITKLYNQGNISYLKASILYRQIGNHVRADLVLILK